MSRLLECSVCDLSVRTRGEWLEHLLLPTHQAQVIVKELFSKRSRYRSLLLFARFPLACREVLEFFSGVHDNPITECVWCSEVPGCVLLMFENKRQAVKAFASVKGPKVGINEKEVEIKKAFQYLEMEWEHLLSPLVLRRSPEPSSAAVIRRRVPKRKKLEGDNLSRVKKIETGGLVQEVENTGMTSFGQNSSGDQDPNEIGGDSSAVDEDITVLDYVPKAVEVEIVNLSDDEET